MIEHKVRMIQEVKVKVKRENGENRPEVFSENL